MMKPVTIYTKPTCGYCNAAKRLLAAKGAAWTEVDVARDPNRHQEMLRRSNGGYTVPQIFIGDEHVGGFDELSALDRRGKLDPLLAA
jgi:glutaredoxin 3